ncbi:hypothetical protein SEA_SCOOBYDOOBYDOO_219 [Mycobacterium phage ScoobyDoobyDoo]|nr:hypothetical protein SEA_SCOOBYDOOBYDOO_219 [Mycobacterium phage ScoobyDoobyDoo]
MGKKKDAKRRPRYEVEVGTITIALPEHIIAAAIEMQVAKILEQDHGFQTWLRKVVEEEVATIAPMHPNMQLVIESVREHLERYPLIGNDPQFQEFVGSKIFEWLQQKPTTVGLTQR